MKLKAVKLILPLGVWASLFIPGASLAEPPLGYDESGTVRFKISTGKELSASPDGGLYVNGQLLVNCSRTPGGKKDTEQAIAKCYPGYSKIEDPSGAELRVYPDHAKAVDASGREYSAKPGAKAKVRGAEGSIGVGADGSVKVHEGGESVTIGTGGQVRIDDGREKVDVTRDAVVSDKGESVKMSQDGTVGTTDGSDTVQVGDGAVQIRSQGESTTITGNWRTRPSSYSAADNEKIMKELDATAQAGRISVELPGEILFDFNSTTIRKEAATTLSKVAHLIRQKAGASVEVLGHTDSIGTESQNKKLSQSRAVSVMRWLNSKEAIPASLMKGRGIGSNKPVAHNTNPDGSDNPNGRARNRRVEILIGTVK